MSEETNTNKASIDFINEVTALLVENFKYTIADAQTIVGKEPQEIKKAEDYPFTAAQTAELLDWKEKGGLKDLKKQVNDPKISELIQENISKNISSMLEEQYSGVLQDIQKQAKQFEDIALKSSDQLDQQMLALKQKEENFLNTLKTFSNSMQTTSVDIDIENIESQATNTVNNEKLDVKKLNQNNLDNKKEQL
ncbi:MAG: hypothetical protein LBC17_03615 [Lactobacillaceae bacterium]|jgi:hypothetical protein|nr:hypothetical protein [Lactobacillaceae bacterium]